MKNSRTIPTSWLALVNLLPKKLKYWVIIDAWAEATTGKYKDTLAHKLTVGTMLQRLDAEWQVTGAEVKPPKRRPRKPKVVTIDGVEIPDDSQNGLSFAESKSTVGDLAQADEAMRQFEQDEDDAFVSNPMDTIDDEGIEDEREENDGEFPRSPLGSIG